MRIYLSLLIFISFSYNIKAQQSVSIQGPTNVEVGFTYNYTFTFNPVYPQGPDGTQANQYIITEWIVSTGTNGGGTSQATMGYINSINNPTSYFYNGTYNNVNPITIPIQWGDSTFLRSDTVTIKVSGIYRNSNTGSNIGYFNYVTKDLPINTVQRIITPNISEPSIIGNCGDQTTSTYTISNQTYADKYAWSVTGGASIMGLSTGSSITVIPPSTPLSGNHQVICTVTRAGGNPLYSKTGILNVARAPII